MSEPLPPLPVEVAPHRPASLLDFAVENAVEGCLRELYGVADAAFRAVRAPTAELRATFALIAKDEERHARLAWDVATWLEPQLSEADRQHVRRAMTRAHHDLKAQLTQSCSSILSAELGAPGARQACAMAASLERSLAA